MNGKESSVVSGICAFGLTTPNADRLAQFYQQAFGFRFRSLCRFAGEGFKHLMGVSCGATSIMLILGDTWLELLQFDVPGQRYPESASSSDLLFQHFAIVVTDMGKAYRRLCQTDGWQPISVEGPVQLPNRSGGVRAFKFRDPDGHPLELLEFPPDATPAYWTSVTARSVCLGIDHSAISVSNSQTSIAFYQAMGFRILGRSLNRGHEQATLDGCEPDVSVELTSLAASSATPHLELLCYQTATTRSPVRLSSNDVAATRLSLSAGQSAISEGILDPDGHRLFIRSAANFAPDMWALGR